MRDVAVQPDTPSHLLALVSIALDELETLPLAATVRRAMRVARLRGEEAEAYRFALELGIEDALQAPGEFSAALGSAHRERVQAEFAQGRWAELVPPGESKARPVMLTVPLDELPVPEAPFEQELSLRSRMERQNRRIQVDAILSKVRNVVFSYLIACETELRLATVGERLFDRHRSRVDAALRRIAPEVLDKLTAAFRRANESDDPEARAQALTSCRRVLTAVADLVFPPQDEPHIDGGGRSRQVGPQNYRNRILAALETAASTTHSQAIGAAVQDFAVRLERLDDLTQKGVHDAVSVDEMEFGVVQTYLLAGEILVIAEAAEAPD